MYIELDMPIQALAMILIAVITVNLVRCLLNNNKKGE